MDNDRSPFAPDGVRSTLGQMWAAFKTRWMHRLLYGGAALAMAYLSVRWSADGFGFAVSERYHWAGILIAICAVTVPEYMFITGHHRGNLTLTIGCLLGYVYGMASNWLGLWVATGMPGLNAGPALFAIRLLLWGPTGVLLEVLPAPMLNSALGLGGDGFFTELADAIAQLRAARQRQTAPPARFSDAVQQPAHHMPPQPHEPPASQRPNMSHSRVKAAAVGVRLSESRETPPTCPHCGSRRTSLRDGYFHCHRCHCVRRGLKAAQLRAVPEIRPREPARPAKPQTPADAAEFSPEAP